MLYTSGSGKGQTYNYRHTGDLHIFIFPVRRLRESGIAVDLAPRAAADGVLSSEAHLPAMKNPRTSMSGDVKPSRIFQSCLNISAAYFRFNSSKCGHPMNRLISGSRGRRRNRSRSRSRTDGGHRSPPRGRREPYRPKILGQKFSLKEQMILGMFCNKMGATHPRCMILGTACFMFFSL